MSLPSISALTAGISLSACTQARTKKPMKPSFTLCFFSNSSFYCARIAITCAMSTSLKVVSMAAVFCASLSRRAMVWRRRLMRTRSSRAASSGAEGARTCTAAAGCATGVGAATARAIASIMSPLVTRPSLPLPGTVDAPMPLSAASLRTEGASGASAGGAFGAVGAGLGGGAGFALGGAAPAGADADFAGAAAPSLIWPSSAPGATVSPSLTRISESTPVAGAGTSIVTLSVSSSTTGSSTATASPGCLNQRPMVASVTDSPKVGTRMSAMIGLLRALYQRVLEQLLELGEMLRHQPGGGGGGCRPAGVARAALLGADLVEHPFDERVDEEPRAHVARLLLAPHHLRLFEAREFLHQRLAREGIELLDAQQIDIVEPALLALL